MRGTEFLILTIFRYVALEWSLNSEGIHNAKFFEENNTRCFLFWLLQLKLAWEISKHGSFFWEKLWNDTHAKVVLMMNLIVGAIYEDILLLTVAMHINDSLNAIFRLWEMLAELIFQSSYHLFDSKNLSMQLLIWVLVLTIKITSREGRPIIPANDTIWIDHWDYLEYELFS